MRREPVSPRLLMLCTVPALAACWLIWRHYPDGLFGPGRQLVVADYLNLWGGGQLAAAGRLGVLFDPHAYAQWLWSVFGPRLDLHTYGYPPTFLLLALPFGQLPIVTGFVLWIVASSTLLWLALRLGGFSPGATLAVVLSPAALQNALLGQNGALTTASLAGGLLLASRRPWLAGLLLSLLCLKPQLGLLVPVFLIARRDWRTLGWAILFGASWCLVSLAVFGWRAWDLYVTVTAPFMRRYLDDPFGLALHYMMVPPFISARAMGWSLDAAYALQAVAAGLCVALVWRAASRAGDRPDLAVALTPLATPYAFSYDLVCVAAACAILARGGLTTGGKLALGSAWMWPGSAFSLGTRICPGLGAVCVGAAAWMAWDASGGRIALPHWLRRDAPRRGELPSTPV